jgi:hypothetical protein
VLLTGKTLSNPVTCLDSPWGFQKVEASRFHDNRHMKVIRLSALHTGRLYPRKNSWDYCLREAEGHSAAERILSMKNCTDKTGNRTRDRGLIWITIRILPEDGNHLPKHVEVNLEYINPLTPNGHYSGTANLQTLHFKYLFNKYPY